MLNGILTWVLTIILSGQIISIFNGWRSFVRYFVMLVWLAATGMTALIAVAEVWKPGGLERWELGQIQVFLWALLLSVEVSILPVLFCRWLGTYRDMKAWEAFKHALMGIGANLVLCLVLMILSIFIGEIKLMILLFVISCSVITAGMSLLGLVAELSSPPSKPSRCHCPFIGGVLPVVPGYLAIGIHQVSLPILETKEEPPNEVRLGPPEEPSQDIQYRPPILNESPLGGPTAPDGPREIRDQKSNIGGGPLTN